MLIIHESGEDYLGALCIITMFTTFCKFEIISKQKLEERKGKTGSSWPQAWIPEELKGRKNSGMSLAFIRAFSVPQIF